MLRFIDEYAIEGAIGILRRGFPGRKASFWEHGFAQLRAVAYAPYGYIFTKDSRDLGLMLTFSTKRSAGHDGVTRAITNLSSWYMEPEERWRAPSMLRRIVSRDDVLFTDLTPSSALERINPALGFRLWNDGEIIAPLPLTAVGSDRDAEIWPFGAAPRGALAPSENALLDYHADRGCLAAVLHESDRMHPLLFRREARHGVPTAQLIYTDSRRAVLANLAPISRFLLRNGLFVLCIDGDRAERPAGCWFHAAQKRYFKGDMDRDRIDYAYSEVVMLPFGR